jgi:hypothetical protein
MKLNDAKFCAECEELFTEGDECPKCNNLTWKYIGSWLSACHDIITNLKLDLQSADAKLAKVWKATGGRG